MAGVCGRNRTGYMDRQRDASGIPLVQRNAFGYSQPIFSGSRRIPQESDLYYSRQNYSYIDTLNKVQSPEYGFDYTLYKNADVDTLYNALITNVLPGSPASTAGLERGEWIVKVDDEYITKKNEKTLLQTGKAMTLTLGKYELQI